MRLKIHLLFILALSFIVSSCDSAKKSFENRRYDRAIELCSKKLHKKPDDQKHIDILLDSYRIANEQDINEIEELRKNGNESSWESIYNAYRRLQNRQQLVKQLPTLRPTNPLTEISFEFRDYSLEMQQSKEKAGEALYNEGVRLLESGDRFSSRKAYEYFQRAAGYNVKIQDLQQKMQLALNNGFTRVLLNVQIKTTKPIPAELEQKIRQINLQNENNNWVKIGFTDEKNIIYHYFGEVLINDVVTSADQINKTIFTEKKNIEDGWEWEKNPDGSIRTDSAGNKIKKIIYREVSASVTKYEQVKQCTIQGTYLFYPSSGNQYIINTPLTSAYSFKNEYAFASGDNRALSSNSLALLQKKPLPFPSETELITLASPNLINTITEQIKISRNKIN